MNEEMLKMLLDRAMNEDLGVVVDAENREYLYQLISDLRTKLNLPLTIFRAGESKILIIKRGAKLP